MSQALSSRLLPPPYSFGRPFAAQGIADRIRELDESSATVALAAQALGCEPGRIAKTLSFQALLEASIRQRVYPRIYMCVCRFTV